MDCAIEKLRKRFLDRREDLVKLHWKPKETALNELNAVDELLAYYEDCLNNPRKITRKEWGREVIYWTEVAAMDFCKKIALFPSWNMPFITLLRQLIPARLTNRDVTVYAHPYVVDAQKEIVDMFDYDVALKAFDDFEEALKSVKDESYDIISAVLNSENARKLKQASPTSKFCLEVGSRNIFIGGKHYFENSAVQGALDSAFIEGGQRCAKISQIYIDRDNFKGFESTFGEKIGRVSPHPLHPKHFERFMEEHPGLEHNSKTFTIRPSYRIGTTDKEVFGPLVYLDRLPKIFNSYCLTASIYTENDEELSSFLSTIRAGTIHINDVSYGTIPQMPFCGWSKYDEGYVNGENPFFFYTQPRVVVGWRHYAESNLFDPC